jgi:hypothetical protein
MPSLYSCGIGMEDITFHSYESIQKPTKCINNVHSTINFTTQQGMPRFP